jgi:hypothetical protein
VGMSVAINIAKKPSPAIRPRPAACFGCRAENQSGVGLVH